MDFGSLQSLKLRRCEDWQDLLILLTKCAEPPRLKSLDIQWTWVWDDWEQLQTYNTLASFLLSFKGLEELFIFTPSPVDSPRLWEAVLSHRASLHRFVHHQRICGMYHVANCLPSDDTPTLSFVDLNHAKGRPGYPFGELDLTTLGLGLCCSFRSMVRK